MDQLYMLRAFVAAAQHQSFSKAAESLGVTTGTISKAIAKLEASIQTRLLHRTTRSVKLADVAQPYYLSCVRLLEEFDEANRRISQEREVDSGRIRLVIHPMFAGCTLARLLSGYRATAPDVNLMISVQDRPVNLYDGHFDIAVLPARLVDQPAVIRRTLWSTSRVLVAAPAYLSQNGVPRQASDLASHFLLVEPGSRQKNTSFLELLEDGRRVSVLPRSSMDGDDVFLRFAALGGTGIATLPEAMVAEDVATGRLERVLPGCSGPDATEELCLFYAHRELMPLRLRTFIDFCTQFVHADRPSALADEGSPRRPVSGADAGLRVAA